MCVLRRYIWQCNVLYSWECIDPHSLCRLHKHPDNDWGKHTDGVKNMSLYYCVAFFILVAIFFSFITRLKPNLRTAATTQNTTENNCVISRTQNATALLPSVSLIRIHHLLFTVKGWWTLLSINCRQGQLQTPQSLCVHSISACVHTRQCCTSVAMDTFALCLTVLPIHLRCQWEPR